MSSAKVAWILDFESYGGQIGNWLRPCFRTIKDTWRVGQEKDAQQQITDAKRHFRENSKVNVNTLRLLIIFCCQGDKGSIEIIT